MYIWYTKQLCLGHSAIREKRERVNVSAHENDMKSISSLHASSDFVRV